MGWGWGCCWRWGMGDGGWGGLLFHVCMYGWYKYLDLLPRQPPHHLPPLLLVVRGQRWCCGGSGCGGGASEREHGLAALCAWAISGDGRLVLTTDAAHDRGSLVFEASRLMILGLIECRLCSQSIGWPDRGVWSISIPSKQGEVRPRWNAAALALSLTSSSDVVRRFLCVHARMHRQAADTSFRTRHSRPVLDLCGRSGGARILLWSSRH